MRDFLILLIAFTFFTIPDLSFKMGYGGFEYNAVLYLIAGCFSLLAYTFIELKFQEKDERHRVELIKLYTSQSESEQPFMKEVLTAAIHKLQAPDTSPYKVENWVVKLEKMWRKWL